MGTNEIIGMTVVALSTILGVGISIVKPILAVVKTMTELNESMKNLADKFNMFDVANTEAHKRLWRHNEEQDEKIQDHETRIILMESRDK